MLFFKKQQQQYIPLLLLDTWIHGICVDIFVLKETINGGPVSKQEAPLLPEEANQGDLFFSFPLEYSLNINLRGVTSGCSSRITWLWATNEANISTQSLMSAIRCLQSPG